LYCSKTFNLEPGTFILRIHEVDLGSEEYLAETEFSADNPFIDVVVTRQGFQLFRKLQRLGKFKSNKFGDPQLGDALCESALDNVQGNKKFVSLIFRLLGFVDKSQFEKILLPFAKIPVMIYSNWYYNTSI